MSRFSIDLVITNNQDLVLAEKILLSPDKVRRLAIQGVVDSGSALVMMPKKLAVQLGLPKSDKVKVRYADNRSAIRDSVKNVYIEILGRSGIFTAVVEPKRTTLLIGAIVLEELDLIVDCKRERVVPRDPRFVISET